MNKIKHIGRVAVVAMSIPLALLAAESGRDKAVRLNGEGVRLLEAQDYKGAMGKFLEALATSPECAAAAKNAGKVLILSQKFGEAKEVLERTLREVPDDAGCMVLMVQACAFLGETKECVKWIERLAEAGDAPTVRSLPLLLRDQGALREAAVAAEASVRKDGADEVRWLNRGLVADAIPNRVIAEESYRKAIELKPDYVDALVNLGNLYERIGRIGDMFATYEKAYATKACSLTEYNLGRKLVMEKRDVSRGLDLLHSASAGDDEAAAAARTMLNKMIGLLKKDGGAK